MAFTKDELAHIDATIGALVRRRQDTPMYWDVHRYEVEFDGPRVRIVEIHGIPWDYVKFVYYPIAQFEYSRTTARWTLYRMLRKGAWRVLRQAEHLTTLPELVKVVDQDPRDVFWS